MLLKLQCCNTRELRSNTEGGQGKKDRTPDYFTQTRKVDYI